MGLHAVLNNPPNRDNNILVSPWLDDCLRTLRITPYVRRKSHKIWPRTAHRDSVGIVFGRTLSTGSLHLHGRSEESSGSRSIEEEIR